ncbi:reverse transcriptase domain-containing protein [Tanacetum coccineum]
MTSVKVRIDVANNLISVRNNGEQHFYVPELIFDKTVTSNNYDEWDGANLVNIYLSEFTIETADGKRTNLRYKQVASVQAKLRTLDALLSLLLYVTQALNKFAQVLDSASSKARDQSVPLAGQADTIPAEGEKNTNQATISQLFLKRAKKNAKKENLKNQQPKPTTPPATTIIPPIITTTTAQMQSPPQYPQKGSS